MDNISLYSVTHFLCIKGSLKDDMGATLSEVASFHSVVKKQNAEFKGGRKRRLHRGNVVLSLRRI